MATTTRFLLKCPDCGHAQEMDVEELDNDPQCSACDYYLGWTVRVEGFRLEPKKIA